MGMIEDDHTYSASAPKVAEGVIEDVYPYTRAMSDHRGPGTDAHRAPESTVPTPEPRTKPATFLS